MSATPNKQKLPLAGVRVLELSHIVAGPTAGILLADLGADVIKIEDPDAGDAARSQFNDGGTFFTFNRNKKYLALNLREARGKKIFEQLVARADVVLDNFGPGAMKRLGLDHEWGSKINPRIIYASVKGFLPGPYGDRPFLDELAQMAGGLAFLTGPKDQPMRAGASITDIGAATYAVIGILAALYRRQTTGIGERVEAGLFETIVFWISQYVTRAQITGANAPARGAVSSNMGTTMGWGVYQLFPTQDGKKIFIAATANRHWLGLCKAFGFDDWGTSPDFNSNRKRTAQKKLIADRITEFTQQHLYDEIAALLYKALVPFAPVNSPLDLVSDKHLNEGNHWMHLKVPGRELKVPKIPIDLGTTQEFDVRNQPDCLGQHTDAILAELGYSASDIDKLKADKVVQRSTQMLNIGSSSS